jgi:PAS domain S-box-containing protein
MPDSPGTGPSRTSVDAWETAETGIDRDPWLRRFRKASRTHETPDDALAFYSRVFLEAPVPIVILGRNHSVADVNVAAQQLVKRSLEKLRGKPFVRIVAKDDRPAFMKLAEDLASDIQKTSRPIRLVDIAGTVIDVAMIASSVRSENGELEFMVLVFLENGVNVSSDYL